MSLIEIVVLLRIVKTFFILIDKQNKKCPKTIQTKINRSEKSLHLLKKNRSSKVRLTLSNKIKMI